MSKKLPPKKIFTLVFTILYAIVINAQNNGYPYVNAGNDVNLTCATGNCTNLTMDYFVTGATNTYTVSSIPFSSPYSFNSGTIIENYDDVFSQMINLGFNFCFFENSYNQLVTGGNGEINFDISLAGTGSGYLINNTDHLPACKPFG